MRAPSLTYIFCVHFHLHSTEQGILHFGRPRHGWGMACFAFDVVYLYMRPSGRSSDRVDGGCVRFFVSDLYI
jgi:hypothetical protein